MDNSNFSKALEFHKKNQLKKAIKIYLSLLSMSEGNKNQILFLLGTAYYQSKNFKESVNCFNNLLAIEPNNFHAYSNLALAQKELNQIEEAISSYNKSIRINPNFSHSYNNLGNLFLFINDYKNALINFNKALETESLPEFFFNRAKAYNKLQNPNQALIDIEKYLLTFPESSKAIIFKIEQLINLNNLTTCAEYLKLSSKYISDSERLYELYARYYLASEKLEDAKENIINIKNDVTKNFYYSIYFYKKNDLQAAIDKLNEISSADYNSNILNNYGLIYRDMGEEQKAKDFFSLSLEHQSDSTFAKLNLGLLALKNYKFSDGWLYYFYRFKPPLDFKLKLDEWKSDILPNEKILVLSEQGIGDQLLFLSTLPFINPDNFIFVIDKRISNILKLNFPKISFISHENINTTEARLYIFLGDILKFFIKNKNDLLNITPIFKKVIDFNFFKKDTSYLNIGLSWKSPNSKSESQARNIGVANLIEPVISNNVIFHNLQYGDISQDIETVRDRFDIDLLIQDIDYFNDLEKLIYIINQMDCVITTDNITAHLAGACGKQSFLLIPESASRIWFWHAEKKHKWYKNTQIYFFEESKINESLTEIKNDIQKHFHFKL